MYEEIKKKYMETFEREKLPYIRCNNCSYIFYYPRDYCPKCGSRKLEVLESNGLGKVFSCTRFFNKEGKEIIYGIVELDEGFRIYTNFMSDIDIGDRVKVKFVKVNDKMVPVFERV